jgi:prevent-host-death family protein
MMKIIRIEVSKATNQPSQLVDRAPNGEKVILTRRGKGLVELTPIVKRTKKRELGFLDFGPVGADFAQRCIEPVDIEWFK